MFSNKVHTFLKYLDQRSYWKTDNKPIILNFEDVEKIGPSFANEAFAYFTKYASPDKILKRIIFKNITQVQRSIIKNELITGYQTSY